MPADNNEPAFPFVSEKLETYYHGLSKRQYVATEIVKSFIHTQGMKAYNFTDGTSWMEEHVIPQSFAIADAILNYDK